MCGLNLLHTPELISNCRTVTAFVCAAPGNDRSIFQNRSKGGMCGLNLLHTPELFLNWRTVTAKAYFTPGNDRSICQNRSKGPRKSGLNLLHTPELILNCQLSPPLFARPQVTTDPSSRIAAKAPPVAWICCTPLSCSWTAELSPPRYSSPQVTIVRSPWHHKAKAPSVAASCGWSTRAVRHSPSSISASSNVCSKLTETRFLAVRSLRCIFPKACRAAVFNSWSEEEGRSVRSSAWPSSKATFILSIELRGWDVLKILTTLQNISNKSPLHTLSPTDSCSHFCKAVEAKCFLLWMTKLADWKTGKPKWRNFNRNIHCKLSLLS